VDPDLGHFGWIVPCGIREHGVTSIGELLRERGAAGRVPDLETVAGQARRHLGEVFGLQLAPGDASELGALELPDGAPLGGIARRFPPAT
jgi:lipoate-protein ligase B